MPKLRKFPAATAVRCSGMINSLLIRSEIHEGQEGCKATQLYGQHDVVGDPQACFMNKLNLPNAVGP
jgi:hypothetical protein